MLIGCGCNCGDVSEEASSEPPSESVLSSAGFDIIEVSSCKTLNRCFDGIVPLRYRINVVSPGGGTAFCHPSYVGEFVLFYQPGFCYRFESAERCVRQVGATCPDSPTAAARWQLNIAGTTTFALQGLFGSFCTSVVNYSIAVSANINCVQSFTLTRTFQDSGWSFPATLLLEVG